MRFTIKYISIIILFLVSSSCEKEISPEQALGFIKFYGSYLMDQAGDVEVLASGGYAICATETSESFGKRMVLIVTDEFGNVRSGFPKYYTEDGMESGGSSLIAIQGGAGGFFLAGFVEHPVEGTQLVQKDIFVVRTAASGAETWQRSYGSQKDEHILHTVEKIDSGFLLAGYKVENGKSDLLVMGVTEEGDSLRLGLNYSNPNAENSTATFLLNAGDKYLCACTYDKINNGGTGIQILTFDDDLSPLAKNLSGEFDEYGMCILDEGEGRFLVLGNRANFLQNESANSEVLLYGIETEGLYIKSSSLLATISESSASLWGTKVIKTASQNLAIVGTRSVGSNSELMLQFVSSSYQVEEQLDYGASGAQIGQDIELSRDKGFVVLGTNVYGENSVISLMKTSPTGDL